MGGLIGRWAQPTSRRNAASTSHDGVRHRVMNSPGRFMVISFLPVPDLLRAMYPLGILFLYQGFRGLATLRMASDNSSESQPFRRYPRAPACIMLTMNPS